MTTSMITFEAVKCAFPEGGELNSQRLNEWFLSLNLPDFILEQENVVQEIVREWVLYGDPFASSPKGWHVKVSGAAVHSVVMSSIAIAALSVVPGAAVALPLVVIPMVVPYLFNIERIELTRKEEILMAYLPLKKSAVLHQPEKIYALLPEDVQDEVGLLEFSDFLEKLSMVGQAKEFEDGSYLIHRDGENVMAVKFT